MQALILHDDIGEANRLGRILARRGFMVSACADQERATRFVRRTPTDLLILKEVIDGRHTTSVSLAAEYNNPHTATLLLSNRSRSQLVEQFDLLPSLRGILSGQPGAAFLTSLALQAVQSPSQNMLVLVPNSPVSAQDDLRVA